MGAFSRRGVATAAAITGTTVLSLVLPLTGPALAAPVHQTAVANLTPAFGSPCGYYVTVNGLRLRTAPSTRASIRGQLYKYDPVTATSSSGSWYHIRLDRRSSGGLKAGTTGWVSKGYLHVDGCTHFN